MALRWGWTLVWPARLLSLLLINATDEGGIDDDGLSVPMAAAATAAVSLTLQLVASAAQCCCKSSFAVFGDWTCCELSGAWRRSRSSSSSEEKLT